MLICVFYFFNVYLPQLVNLNEMNLVWSKHLTSCPDLSAAPNLEELNLVGCTSLVEITPSVQSLKKIEYLDLRDCESLTGLPDLSGMKSLESLHLAGCSSLKWLPKMPCNIELLILDETAIEELPLTIEHLSTLVVLNLNRCSRLRSLPNSICKFKSLQFDILGWMILCTWDLISECIPVMLVTIMRHLSSSILALTIMENVEKAASSKSVGCV